MATKKDGLPRRAYAYAPTPDPSTWKLPYLSADGSVDTERLPLAAAALSEGGHRGERADIPRDALANVKSKLRQAYRRWKGSDAEYPDSIRESEVRLEEAVDELMAEADPDFDEFEAEIAEHKTAKEHPHTFGRTGSREDVDADRARSAERRRGEGEDDRSARTTRMARRLKNFRRLLKRGSGNITLQLPGLGPMSIPLSRIKTGPATAEDETTFTVGGVKFHVATDDMTHAKESDGARRARRARTREAAIEPESYDEEDLDMDDLFDHSVLREATILIDRAPVAAKVLTTPDGDTLVFPEWTGAFDPPAPETDKTATHALSAGWDVQTATRLLGELYSLKSSEVGGSDETDAAQIAQIDRAIEGILGFIQSEGQEMTDMAEAGRRHAKKDEGLLRQFHQLLKELGVECEDPAREQALQAAVTEADAGATPEVITFRESGFDLGLVTLREAAPKFDDANRTVWITPIKPGWGNKRDKFFYTEGALKEATASGLFNNIKMFKDHPRKSDEKELPERSVKDWFATTREAVWDEARGVPRVPIKVHDEGDYSRFKDVPEQVAFSVLGGGLARPGKVNGESGRIVESLKNVRSVDWVTEAGAGGSIDFAESAAQEHEDIKMEIENLSDEQIKAEATRRGLIRESDGEGEKGEGETPATETPAAPATQGTESNSEVRAEADKEREEGGEMPPAEATQPAAEPAENKESATEAVEQPPVDMAAQIKKAVDEALAAERAKTEVKESAKKAVAAELAESDLPKRAKDVILTTFREATFGDGQVYTDEPALRAGVQSEIAKAAALLGLAPRTSKVSGMGDSGEEGERPVRESVATRIDQKFGPSGVPKEAAITESGEEAAVSSTATGVADRIGSKFGRA